MFILLILMAIMLASLWQQVRILRGRVDALGFAGPASWPAHDDRASDVTAPREVKVERVAEPAPTAFEALPLVAGPARTGRDDPPARPEPAPDPVIPVARDHGSGFEDLFGRRLPIWAGGVTLAVAGFLIVRYSIQAGLLSPAVRLVMGLVFGGGLIAGAEIALRSDARVRDPRVRQALAGAGIATLYATVLAAANLYHLIAPAAAFAALAAITAMAGGLSLRFGAPSALLGLVGGLAAPALVGSAQPDVPLLTLYLALAVGGLCALGRQQRWWWLGAAALAGGFGWGALLIYGGALDFVDTLAVGGYTLTLGIALPLLIAGDRSAMMRLGGSLLGCAQLAGLVAVGGFAPLHWGLFGLISIAIVWLSRREPLFADVPAAGLGIALLLAVAWPDPTLRELTLFIAATIAIYGVPALRRVWRADVRPIDAPSLAVIALATGLLPLAHFHPADMPAAALIAALLAAGAAALGWRSPTRCEDARFAMLAVTSAFLLAVAGMQTVVAWAWAPMVALLALGLYLLGERARDPRVMNGGWCFGIATIVLLALDPSAARLMGFEAIIRLDSWGVPALVAGFLAWRAGPRLGSVIQPAAVLVAYGAGAQIVPADWLPLVPAAIVAALAVTRRSETVPALAAATLLAIGWAFEPLALWTGESVIAATGRLVTIEDWPALGDAALRLALPGAALLAAARLMPLDRAWRDAGRVIGAVGLIVAAHVAFKHIFAIADAAGFVAHAMAERTMWEMALAAFALFAWHRDTHVAHGFGIASLVHFGWFTIGVANPLFVEQQVGPWLVVAYAVAGALLWQTRDRRLRDLAVMALITIGSFTVLRQFSHDPMLLGTGTWPAEQIARSVLAIALAGAFLWTGIARQAREWRIASLALMLVAVAKVFLFDAAGLDGLARIASFAALGFSLIGVGWFYSRYLPDGAR